MALSVEDQLAIQQLYAKYNHAIDAGQGDDWAACFTADGTFKSPSGTFTGTEQLAGFGSGMAKQIKARHWVNNLVVEANGDGAKGSCYLVLYLLKGAGNPPNIIATGIYRDELAKGPDGWKLHEPGRDDGCLRHGAASRGEFTCRAGAAGKETP